MFKPKILAVALSAVVPIAGAGLVGCEVRQRGEEERFGETPETGQVDRDEFIGERERGEELPPQGEAAEREGAGEMGAPDEEVRGIEPVRGQELGRTTVTEDEKELQARKRVLETTIAEYEIPTVRICEEKADLNEMNAQHFSALGISPGVAERIVQFRDQRGRITAVSQLREVQGVDDSTLRSLEQQVAVRPQGQ